MRTIAHTNGQQRSGYALRQARFAQLPSTDSGRSNAVQRKLSVTTTERRAQTRLCPKLLQYCKPRAACAAQRYGTIAMKTRLLFLCVLGMLFCAELRAQQTLRITDALPPYSLTATLLGNGHFSVSTRYTGESKTLIYREDGTGNRPVNYTSHVHFKVDDVVFQLPYELNPITRTTPPEHPLSITELFRDTTEGRERINARMFGIMPDGDTMRFVFSMQPVQRPSGGFIRLSAAVHNSTAKARSVGVLMLIDTKIGNNDRAPIVTAFGYQNVETQYSPSVAPGLPDFWLALEGSPVNPQLTTRGNLRASGLIEPTLFLFGNWVDYTAQGILGLASAQWKERVASGLEYTDSAVLLVWDEENMPAGQQRMRASTEIGIVDSLKVQETPPGDPYDVAIAGAGTCLTYETQEENPCGAPDYHPYVPDSLQTLYIVTNRGAQDIANLRVVLPQLPPSLSASTNVNGVIPATLGNNASGVATVTLYAKPRLQQQRFDVPVAVVADAADTVLRDTICVIVPGLQGVVQARDVQSEPLCPNLADTLDVTVALEGARCLPITSLQLVGTLPDLALFSLVPPLPTEIPANGEVTVRVRYQPNAVGTHRVRLAVEARDFETFIPGDTTFVFLRDTNTVVGNGRDAEFFFANADDILDLGAVCIGDTVEGEWNIQNTGGCTVVIDQALSINGKPNQFIIGNNADFPLAIPRGERRTVRVRFAPLVAGQDEALLIVTSTTQPNVDTLILRGRGDAPLYAILPVPVFDTLCPGETSTRSFVLENPTACPVRIDSLTSTLAGFSVAPSGAFTIPPLGTVRASVRAAFATTGTYTAVVTAHSTSAGIHSTMAQAVVRNRALLSITTLDYGDIRLGTSTQQTLTFTAEGDATTYAEVVITGIRIAGIHSSEFAAGIPAGTFPLHLQPGEQFSFSIVFTPTELEERHAVLTVLTAAKTFCAAVPATVELRGRGVLPIIDVPQRGIDFGRVCAGASIDTVLAIRNRGNAPLVVDTTMLLGSADMEIIAQLPAVIPPDSTQHVRVRFTPQTLGPLETTVIMGNNGTWFSAPDTVVRLTGTGILCGTVWTDTLRAETGTVIDIPIRLRPAAGLALTTADMVRLMNQSGFTSVAVSIAHNPKLFRFRSIPVVAGMMASGQVNVTPQRGTASITGGLSNEPVLAVLRGDVLLGNAFETELRVAIDTFANGYADIQTRNGLLISEYCAIDKRYLLTNGVQAFVQPRQTPLARDGELDIYLPQSSHTRLVLFNTIGQRVAELPQQLLPQGKSSVSLAGLPLPSGVYLVVLETETDQTTSPLLIAE